MKLTWWQKLLQVIGLYKAPEKPQARKTTTREPSVKTPKSNVRVAQTSPKEQDSYEPRTRDDSYEPKSPRNNKRRRGGDPSTVESARVYVGNLSYDVTEQDLQELFKGVGTVRRSEIVYNRNTHRSKGYGFVEMIHKDDAMRAVEVLHDQPFMGRNMTVSGAKSKQQEDEDLEDNGPEINAADIQLAPLPEPTPAAEQVATDDAPVAEQAAAESEAPQAEETPAAQPEAAASEEATQADAGKSEEEQRNFTLNS